MAELWAGAERGVQLPPLEQLSLRQVHPGVTALLLAGTARARHRAVLLCAAWEGSAV